MIRIDKTSSICIYKKIRQSISSTFLQSSPNNSNDLSIDDQIRALNEKIKTPSKSDKKREDNHKTPDWNILYGIVALITIIGSVFYFKHLKLRPTGKSNSGKEVPQTSTTERQKFFCKDEGQNK